MPPLPLPKFPVVPSHLPGKNMNPFAKNTTLYPPSSCCQPPCPCMHVPSRMTLVCFDRKLTIESYFVFHGTNIKVNILVVSRKKWGEMQNAKGKIEFKQLPFHLVLKPIMVEFHCMHIACLFMLMEWSKLGLKIKLSQPN